MEDQEKLEYAGFWIRVWASIIDTALLAAIIVPIMLVVYDVDYYVDSLSNHDSWVAGPTDFFLSYVFPAVVVIVFWVHRQATPGKMAIRATIVDAVTGEKPTTAQCVGRYFAYIPSTLILGLGILWVAFDKRKQGWHDKLAGTVVVRKKSLVAFRP